MIRFHCPSCARPWGLANQAAGSMWTCPICHAQVNVPAGAPSPEQPRERKTHHSRPLKRKKPPAAGIPVSADAGFELLEETGHRPTREPVIPVDDDGDDASSHTKIRRQLRERNHSKGDSSGEIDRV